MFPKQPTQWRVKQSAASVAAPSRTFQPRRQSPQYAATTTDMEDHDRDNFDEVAQIARSAYKIGKELMGELNVEYKLIENNTFGVQPTNDAAVAGSTNILNQCIQGVTDTSRTGDSIKCSNLMLRGRIFATASGASSLLTYVVRIIVFRVLSEQAITAVFPANAADTTGLLDYIYKGSTLAPYAALDYDSDARPHILWDKKFMIDPYHPQHEFAKLIKLNFHTQFDNNTNTINTGALKMVLLSQAPSTDVNRPTVDWLSRVYFLDN